MYLDHAKTLRLNPDDFRILCRNGSLADRTGFDVELDCALTTIVDGEVLVARNNPKTPGIINAINSFDKYFELDPEFKMYNIFSGKQDLLFKVKANCNYFLFSFTFFINGLLFLIELRTQLWD